MDDTEIRALVRRLARSDRATEGGHVIERAAILAEGSDCAAIEAWIERAGGRAEAPVAAPEGGGLHAGRRERVAGTRTPANVRYLLPPGALDD